MTAAERFVETHETRRIRERNESRLAALAKGRAVRAKNASAREAKRRLAAIEREKRAARLKCCRAMVRFARSHQRLFTAAELVGLALMLERLGKP